MLAEITPELQARLLQAARDVQEQAYAPYSQHPVGAALLTPAGQIFVGANVENASFPLGICAEQAALAGAVSRGERSFLAVAVVTPREGVPIAPCGGCRQVLSEFGPDMWVVLPQGSGAQAVPLHDLLPSSFGPDDLEHLSG